MNNLSSSDKKKLVFLGYAGLAFLGVLLYSNILLAPFVFDDTISIIFSPAVRSIRAAVQSFADKRYIGFVSFAFNYAVGGLKPFGYHLVNVIIHISNAFLVYCLLRLTFRTSTLSEKRSSSIFIAFAVSFLFLVHPIQTQAVTYIAQRFTSLATFFYLASLLAYVKARMDFIEERKNITAQGLGLYGVSVVCALLALKTKEIAVTLPFAMLLYDIYFFPKDEGVKKRLLYVAPLFLTLLIIPLTSPVMMNPASSVDDVLGKIDTLTQDLRVTYTRSEYLITQFRVIVTYLRLLVLPVDQIFDYDYPVYRTFFSAEIIASFVFLSLLVLLGILTYKKQRLVSFGIIWFFLTLSVESSFIPIRDVINEHRLYLPSIGFFLVAASLAEKFIPKQKAKIAVLAIVVMALSITTYARNNTWRDPESLWADTIEKAPHNARAYGSLGILYKKRGEHDKALEMFTKSMDQGKAYPEVFLHIGDIYYEKADYQQALKYLQWALETDLEFNIRLSILNKLGRTYEKLGDNVRAINSYEEAIRRYPKSTVPYNNLGVLYVRTGKFDDAIQIFKDALKNREAPYLYQNLSIAYTRKGETSKAAEAYSKYLSMKRE